MHGTTAGGILALLAASVALKAADDANAILMRYIEADARNAGRASQYTYVAKGELRRR